MKIGDRVKLPGRRVAATVIEVREMIRTEGGDAIKMPDDQGEVVGQTVLLEFDRPVRYNRSKTQFQVGWFDAENCVMIRTYWSVTTARKEWTCVRCGLPIKKGVRHFYAYDSGGVNQRREHLNCHQEFVYSGLTSDRYRLALGGNYDSAFVENSPPSAAEE